MRWVVAFAFALIAHVRTGGVVITVNARQNLERGLTRSRLSRKHRRMPVPRLVLVGPTRHGVTQYARDLAEAVTPGFPSDEVFVDECAAATAMRDSPETVHLHVTDRIFGTSPEEAADLVERMAHSTRFTVTLHDLPQPSDGANSLRRRSAAYQRIAAASAGVVVSSRHEASLFSRYIDPNSLHAPAVIPLGTRPSRKGGTFDPNPSAERSSELTILIAGFVYPGKGHDDAIAAVAAVAARRTPKPAVGVRALGAVSEGHERELRRLENLASMSSVRFEVTGYLSDVDYASAQQSQGIPLAAHQHISASRTMLDWIEAGRRPLVVESDYAREMADLRPGTMTVYDRADLVGALERASEDPGATYLDSAAAEQWTLVDAAAAYVRWWDEAVTW